MRKRILIILVFYLSTQLNVLSKSDLPKREFRGAWIATVVNLDWPSPQNINPVAQRTELVILLDELKEAGINAVIFQVRSECDALYESTIEPWSYWLTGKQGEAPKPFYDPLEFAIAEAHKRGMELHAWFNPYRAIRRTGTYVIDSNHVSVKHPDWILSFPAYPSGKQKILDPGLSEVRNYVTSVIMDVVYRYDVDGVHFDDYFYPYPDSRINFSGINNEDYQTFANYSRGFKNRGDWRRDNVNLLVKMVYDSIQAVKPYVKFGISPFGIWKWGVPTGIKGLDAYNDIYCDALAWLDQKNVDYLTPQLYWPFGGGQDYGKLLPWWASKVNGRHLYPGQAPYRINNVTKPWTSTEMPNQIRLNRRTSNVFGSVFFRATFGVLDNQKGFTDSLKTYFYRYPALVPVMAWKDSIPPNMPQNLRYERLSSTGPAGLHWDTPAIAADGDSANRYVIYRFDRADIKPDDINDPGKILLIQGGRTCIPETPPDTNDSYYYVVTALDRNSNESTMSRMLQLFPPPTPVLASPADGEPDQPSEIILSWYYPENAATYHLQVSTDSSFSTQLDINETGIVDTFKVLNTLNGQEKYYWRIKASNAGGTSSFSNVSSFTTGFPASPMLVYPTNNTGNISVKPAFTWNIAPGATSYRLQVAQNPYFKLTSIIFDSSGIIDTTFSELELESNRFYHWRVNATNSIGTSTWSEVFRFRTSKIAAVAEKSGIPTTFKLYPNYPNPFNATTTISFDLAKECRVMLKVYNALGREVATIIDEILKQGHHKVLFGSSDLSSGIYFTRLFVNDQIFTVKMLLLK